MRSGTLSINNALTYLRQRHLVTRRYSYGGEISLAFGMGQPHTPKLDTPVVMYNESMDAIGKLYKRLFDYGGVPGPKTDIEYVVVAPSEKHRLRLLKGLEPGERNLLINQVQQLHMAFVGFLRHAQRVLDEERRLRE